MGMRIEFVGINNGYDAFKALRELKFYHKPVKLFIGNDDNPKRFFTTLNTYDDISNATWIWIEKAKEYNMSIKYEIYDYIWNDIYNYQYPIINEYHSVLTDMYESILIDSDLNTDDIVIYLKNDTFKKVLKYFLRYFLTKMSPLMIMTDKGYYLDRNMDMSRNMDMARNMDMDLNKLIKITLTIDKFPEYEYIIFNAYNNINKVKLYIKCIEENINLIDFEHWSHYCYGYDYDTRVILFKILNGSIKGKKYINNLGLIYNFIDIHDSSYRNDALLYTLFINEFDSIIDIKKLDLDKEIIKNIDIIDRKVIALSDLFKEKFRRVPNIINYIAVYSLVENISDIDIVRNFNYKLLKTLLNMNYMPYCAIEMMYKLNCMNWPCITLMNRSMLNKLVSADICEYTCNWVLSNYKCNNELLQDVIISDSEIREILDNKRSQMISIKEMREIIDKYRIDSEIKKIEDEYSMYKFKFSECKFELPKLSVTDGPNVAFIMNKNDKRMVTLGYDTHCCQHLGAAGETAMMYGLMSPRAGFWAIEKNNKIIAQAEVWEGYIISDGKDTSKRVFVFDNIELANNRDIKYITSILRKWCKQYPYRDIAMGKGYNNIKIGKDICEPDDKNCIFQPPVSTDTFLQDVYTDAEVGNKVWLKKGGEVTF